MATTFALGAESSRLYRLVYVVVSCIEGAGASGLAAARRRLTSRSETDPRIIPEYVSGWSDAGSQVQQHSAWSHRAHRRIHREISRCARHTWRSVSFSRFLCCLAFCFPIIFLFAARCKKRHYHGKFCPSVRLPVCDVEVCRLSHVGWNTSKIISRLISLGFSLSVDPTSWIYSKWNIPNIPHFTWNVSGVLETWLSA